MKTRRGIYYNLNETEYKVYDGKLKLYFSSEFNMMRYLDKRDEFVCDFNLRVSNIIGLKADLTIIACWKLYRKVEGRGHKVEFDGKEIKEGEVEFEGIVRGLN